MFNNLFNFTSTGVIRQVSLLNYMWIFFSEHSDGEQVFFVSEENSDIIFEIELEDR